MAFDLVAALLQTQALQIAPPGQAFWYTSGTIGPYYINTHYLYGGPERAGGLLEYIQTHKEDRSRFPGELTARVRSFYAENPVYRAVADALAQQVLARGGGEADFVSGGERRDWFFSPAVADLLHKPHLLLYKDRSAVLWRDGQTGDAGDLAGTRAAHVADLVTEASSYFKSWMPAVQERGGRLACGVNVVDRGQGGIEALEQAGLPAAALLRVDHQLFDALLQAGRIGASQHATLKAYQREPGAAMKQFLQEHPDFLRQALRDADEKRAARARMLVERNPYALDLAALGMPG